MISGSEAPGEGRSCQGVGSCLKVRSQRVAALLCMQKSPS